MGFASRFTFADHTRRTRSCERDNQWLGQRHHSNEKIREEAEEGRKFKEVQGPQPP